MKKNRINFIDKPPQGFREVRSQFDFDHKGDNIIVICNKGVPFVGQCRFFQSTKKSNLMAMRDIKSVAKQFEVCSSKSVEFIRVGVKT